MSDFDLCIFHFGAKNLGPKVYSYTVCPVHFQIWFMVGPGRGGGEGKQQKITTLRSNNICHIAHGKSKQDICISGKKMIG